MASLSKQTHLLFKGLYKQRIKYKFGNERRRPENQTSQTIARKMKRRPADDGDDGNPKEKKSKESEQNTSTSSGAYGLENYRPRIPSIEK